VEDQLVVLNIDYSFDYNQLVVSDSGHGVELVLMAAKPATALIHRKH